MKEVVWSVNISIGIGLIAVAWVIFYILNIDKNEEKNSSYSHSDETSDKSWNDVGK